MAESTRMLLGLAIGIILMIVLVSKTKAHTFIALLLAAMVTGLIGGMLPGDVTVDGATKTGIITAIQNGFGNTLRSTGIIIGLGVMMGAFWRNPARRKNGLFLYSGRGQEERGMGAGDYRMVYRNPGFRGLGYRDFRSVAQGDFQSHGKIPCRACAGNGGGSAT